MRHFLLRRPRYQLFLDALFALWVLHVLLTGSLVPGAVEDLLHQEQPRVAVSEPVQAPVLEDTQPSLPET